MWQDPIVQETRQLREVFASQHGHDADAIFQAIMEKQSLSQRPRVSYARRLPTYTAQPVASGDALPELEHSASFRNNLDNREQTTVL
ncbi:MAG: hypothetical protein WC091_16355 [Sulfuricellaceae bacterium]